LSLSLGVVDEVGDGKVLFLGFDFLGRIGQVCNSIIEKGLAAVGTLERRPLFRSAGLGIPESVPRATTVGDTQSTKSMTIWNGTLMR
jgi:hypothetical protein